MALCQTKFNGVMSYVPEQVLKIPDGFFGFTAETEWLLIELPSTRPLVFIQSLRTASLCFLALPAQVIDSGYQLTLRTEDCEWLGWSAGTQAMEQAAVGKDVLCLALLALGEGRSASANLQAPLLIDIAKHRGRQVIVDADYSHVHEFTTESVVGAC